MKLLQELCRDGPRRFAWVRPGREQAYVLPVAGDLAAVLHILRDVRSGWLLPYPGEAEAADGRWVFRREGVFRRGTEVRGSYPGGPLLHTLSPLGGGVLLRIPQNGSFRWERARGLESSWTDGGAPRSGGNGSKSPLVHFAVETRELAGEPVGGQVEIAPVAAANPHLSLLVLLGWYLSVVSYLEELYGIV